jgi:type I restriction enzyme S subunit
MKNDLPPNWLEIPLKEIITIQKGKKPQNLGDKDSNRTIPYINIAAFETGYIAQYAPSDQNIPLCKKTDTLLVWDGARAGLSGTGAEGYIGSTIARIESDFTYPKYLYTFISSQYSYINSRAKGTGIPHVDPVVLGDIVFPLPPLNEQERIIEKVDGLFSELDNGIEELETAQKKLELYRQSLLKSAVEGELSKAWRETQTEISETGEQLLARILKERRERWEQEKLKEFAEKGKNPPKNWQEKYPEPVQPDTENLPQLPEGWVWASLDQVMLIKGGIQKKPSRAPIQNKFPFLRVANVYRAQLILDEIHEIELFEGEIERYKLETGDLLIVEGNGSLTEIGRCAIWDGSIPNAVHQNHLIRARPIQVLSQYLETWLNSSDGINYMAKLAVTTSGLYSLSVGKIAQIPVPLPPLNEQTFITIDLAAKLEQQAQQLTNLEDLQNLNQLQKKNILSDAFLGKLVPQNPNDEPAQVLLERIQQQREAEALVKKSSTKKRSTSKAKKEVGMSQSILEILQQQSDWISGQELATAFGINGNSKIEEIEQFYEQLRKLSLDDKIMVRPDQQNKKEQDLIKLKDKTNAS